MINIIYNLFKTLFIQIQFSPYITRNKVRCPKGTYYVIDWGSFSDVEKFYEYFYKNATVYLERKKIKFEEIVSLSKEVIRYRKK